MRTLREELGLFSVEREEPDGHFSRVPLVNIVDDLIARIVAAVEAETTFQLPTGDYVDKDAVLDAIRQEVER